MATATAGPIISGLLKLESIVMLPINTPMNPENIEAMQIVFSTGFLSFATLKHRKPSQPCRPIMAIIVKPAVSTKHQKSIKMAGLAATKKMLTSRIMAAISAMTLFIPCPSDGEYDLISIVL